MSLKIMYTTHADATGGRNGHTKSADGIVDVNLTIPKAMGGPGREGCTTPEDLFAAGYAACFGSAAEFVSKQMKLAVGAIKVRCEVGIGAKDGGGFGLAVKLHADVAGVSQEEAEKLIATAHQVCPYSNATRNNIDVAVSVSVS